MQIVHNCIHIKQMHGLEADIVIHSPIRACLKIQTIIIDYFQELAILYQNEPTWKLLWFKDNPSGYIYTILDLRYLPAGKSG